MEALKPTRGLGWTWIGFLVGIIVSVSANVYHSYLIIRGQSVALVGPLALSAFWPVALVITVEIIARVHWPEGWIWWTVRYLGLSAVAVIAAVASYTHMSGLMLIYHEQVFIAYSGPVAIDGLMAVSSVALLAIGENTRKRQAVEPAAVVPAPEPFLPRPQALPAVVPAELVPEPVEVPAAHQVPSVNGRRQAGQRGAVAGTAELYEKARQHYLAAVADGKTLTGADLAQVFGKSPRWARDRIREAKAEPATA